MSSLLQYVDRQRSLIALSSLSSKWYLEVKTGQYFSHLLKLNEAFISILNLFTDAPPLVTNFSTIPAKQPSTQPSDDKKVLLETQQSFFLNKFIFSLQTSNAKKKTKKKTIWLQIGKSGYIRCFLIQECTILNGISRKNRFMSALNNTVYRYSW